MVYTGHSNLHSDPHGEGISHIDYLRDCEERYFPADDVRPIPHMFESRTSVIPCEFNGYVYLCGGGTTGIEAFHPQSNTFLLLLRTGSSTECRWMEMKKWWLVVSQ